VYFLKRSVILAKPFYQLSESDPTNKFLLAIVKAEHGVAQTSIHTNIYI